MDYFIDEERRNAWRILGDFYGYPSCCIESFCKDPFTKTPDQIKVGDLGFGFIPCPEHARQVVNKEIELTSLISGRQADHPFPLCDTKRDVEKIKKLLGL